MELSTKILSDITVYMKYAKYLPELKRRENWDEIVGRNVLMHTTKFPDLATEIYNAYKLVYDKKVLPSMRSLQFAGKPIAVNPSRIFNCSFLPIDDYRAFSETMFLLLGGCFEENTELLTIDGVKKIKDISCNDYVKTYNFDTKEYTWVQPSFAGMTLSGHKQKIELTLENGKKIQCTADHEFLTTNRGWVKASELSEIDDIQIAD